MRKTNLHVSTMSRRKRFVINILHNNRLVKLLPQGYALMKPQAGEFFIYIEEIRYQKGRHSISNDAVHGVKGGGQGTCVNFRW